MRRRRGLRARDVVAALAAGTLAFCGVKGPPQPSLEQPAADGGPREPVRCSACALAGDGGP